MKINEDTLKKWIRTKTDQLPGLDHIFSNASADVLVIGAAVFEIYEELGWISPLKRKTGDIDLSIGIVKSNTEYEKAKNILLENEYKADDHHPYRYLPKRKIPGGFQYIDLLAHPNSPSDRSLAISSMGAGAGFSFEGFEFAKIEHYDLCKGAIFPNPFGLIALKRAAYLNEPLKRIKDFADIVELVNGLIEKGSHFKLDKLWVSLKSYKESQQITEMFKLSTKESAVGDWDIDNIQTELNQRGFDNDFIEDTIKTRLRDFKEMLETA
jgi:hypothetical protein